MMDHYHCPGPRCYWRIQFGPTCSKCGGPTVQEEGCCGPPEDERVVRGDGPDVQVHHPEDVPPLDREWHERRGQ